MLFSTLDLIQFDLGRGLLTLATMSVALIAAITVHEFSHALAASTLGDQTARRLGRLSLHPLAHLDPVGTTLIFVAGFGWGKPVPVNPMYLRIGGRQGMSLVKYETQNRSYSFCQPVRRAAQGIPSTP